MNGDYSSYNTRPRTAHLSLIEWMLECQALCKTFFAVVAANIVEYPCWAELERKDPELKDWAMSGV